jgi:hypothetical protein
MVQRLLVGAALAAALTGCSLTASGSSSTGEHAAVRHPSNQAVSRTVHGAIKDVLPAAEVQSKCSVLGARRARCSVAIVSPAAGISGGVPVETLFVTFRRAGDGWRIEPDCPAVSRDVLCRGLRQTAPEGIVVER